PGDFRDGFELHLGTFCTLVVIPIAPHQRLGVSYRQEWCGRALSCDLEDLPHQLVMGEDPLHQSDALRLGVIDDLAGEAHSHAADAPKSCSTSSEATGAASACRSPPALMPRPSPVMITARIRSSRRI